MRKESYVTLMDEGRELTFKITAMDAVRQARWISKVIILLASTGAVKNISQFELAKLEEEFNKRGLEMVFEIVGKLEYEKVEPLLNEMLACCAHVPDSTNRNFVVQMSADKLGAVVSDWKNIYKLAFEAGKVNFRSSATGSSSPTRKKADMVIPKPM